MFLQSKMYLWETLTVKLQHYLEIAVLRNPGVVTIETDAVTTAKILDGTIQPLISQLTL
jgi:hypothetical protein